MKKGQVQQVFIYLMVIIVVGTLLLVGYKVINGLMDRGCDVETHDFILTIKSELDANSEYGSSDKVYLKTPCDYDEICFLNASSVNAAGNPDLNSIDNRILLAEYPVIEEEYSAGTGMNVFLVNQGFVEPILNVKGLDVEGSFTCIQSRGGHFEIKMEGIRRGKIFISDPFTG